MSGENNLLARYPQDFKRALAGIILDGTPLYAAGGPVRDWLIGRDSIDLDITVVGDGLAAARRFARAVSGVFVLLDQDEGVGRVVRGGDTVDFAGLRRGARNISGDLALRDFTINAMAVALDAGGEILEAGELLDPLNGRADLEAKIIRSPGVAAFHHDPLRLIRAYRFAASLGFTIEPQTLAWIEENRQLAEKPAAERILHELELIFSRPVSGPAIEGLADSGLLGVIFPELLAGAGLAQPASHHLDVLQHNLAALSAIDGVLADPAGYYPAQAGQFRDYLAAPEKARYLKWAALFHDLGKPAARLLRDDGRITFYNHDRVGAELFKTLAERIRLGREAVRVISSLISLHMWPFHLGNAMGKTGITPRACLRLVKAAGEDLPGLFLLAMADNLAAMGPGKPVAMEETLEELYGLIDSVNRERIAPVLHGPRLVTGHDLIDLGLSPGPRFKDILDGLERARVEGDIRDREAALSWVNSYLAENSSSP